MTSIRILIQQNNVSKRVDMFVEILPIHLPSRSFRPKITNLQYLLITWVCMKNSHASRFSKVYLGNKIPITKIHSGYYQTVSCLHYNYLYFTTKFATCLAVSTDKEIVNIFKYFPSDKFARNVKFTCGDLKENKRLHIKFYVQNVTCFTSYCVFIVHKQSFKTKRIW